MNTTILRTSALERFLKYVTFDTQSDPDSAATPSTPKQLVLLDELVQELNALGLKDAIRDDQGVVMATIPATSKKADVPVIGILAHVDTSPELSGANVKPIVHRAYDGKDIVLPNHPEAVLRVSEIPDLRDKAGEDIVTSSGDTLLGINFPVRCCSNRTSPARSVAGSNAIDAGLTDSIIERNTSTRPSAVRCGRSIDRSTPATITSGALVGWPDDSSMPMRQIPIEPPRSDAK